MREFSEFSRLDILHADTTAEGAAWPEPLDHRLPRLLGWRDGRGFTADEAWALAMGPGGSRAVCDFQGGGYVVPATPNREMAPPDKRRPIQAIAPWGLIWILPGHHSTSWRLFQPGAPRCPRCHGTTTHTCDIDGCKHCDDCHQVWYRS